MKQLVFSSLLLALIISSAFAQSNSAEYVYAVMQSRCASCHSNASPAGNLDLEGAGATTAAKMAMVYANTFDVPSHNATSNASGYKVIYPGNAWRSTLFRKINAGLQPNMVLEPGEGDDHSDANHNITDVEKEAIRQWILFGAPPTGKVMDVPTLQRYYAGAAEPSFATPPAPPAAGEGFQIHMGPFFLEEDGEEEFFWKYPTELTQDLEVHKIEALFGSFSHHFILFDYNPGQHNFRGDGFRLDAAHVNTQLVSVQQFSDTLDLPQGSAFFWEAGTYLDLNSHYINYTSDKVASCEVYLNIYTQPKGTAAQEMHVDLLANTSIWIPNDGNTHSFSEPVFDPSNTNNIYIWALTSHTHQYGTDFDVFTRNAFGTKNDHIFDAQYMDGDPNGLFIGYDYQHPPLRFYKDFLTIKANEGLIYDASYVNTGNRPVGWGDTSDDEMMVLAYFYLEDTAGVSTSDPTTSIDRDLYGGAEVSITPNPIQDFAYVNVRGLELPAVNMGIFDLQGKKIQEMNDIRLTPGQVNTIRFERNGLSAGLYLCKLSDVSGQIIKTTKMFIR